MQYIFSITLQKMILAPNIKWWSHSNLCNFTNTVIKYHRDTFSILGTTDFISSSTIQMSPNVTMLNHQKSFNLTWWHLVTCHDIVKPIRRGVDRTNQPFSPFKVDYSLFPINTNTGLLVALSKIKHFLKHPFSKIKHFFWTPGQCIIIEKDKDLT